MFELNQCNYKKIPFTKEEYILALDMWKSNNPKVRSKSLIKNFQRKQQRNFKDLPRIIGIDTETFNNGNLLCLSNSENKDTLYGGYYSYQLPTIREYFNYFRKLKRGKEGNTLFFCYNLGFDARIILKSIGNKLKEFYEGEDEYKLDLNGIEISYLNKKYLKLKSSRNTVEIFDAYQFFIGSGKNGSSSLDEVSKAYEIGTKQYDGIYQDKNFPSIISKEELKKIVNYCQLDTILVKKLMEIWITNFEKNFNFFPSKYYSCGNLALEYIYKQIPDFLNFTDIDYDIQYLAYEAYFGGRFEIFKRGFLRNVFHYDIKSAYPFVMSLLPDFKNGKWFKINSLEEFKNNSQYVGFYKIKCEVDEKNLAPFMYRDKLGKVFCPNGFFETATTSFELKIALESFNVKIFSIEGYYFIPNSNEKTDFNKHNEYMFKARLKQKNKGQKYIYKILLNSGYGKFAQVKPKPKGIFNPVMCSAITGYCRAMLLDAVKDKKESVLMFATDGIFTSEKLNLDLTKNKLGSYEFEFHPKMQIIMAGIYANNLKDDTQMTTKTRGFTAKCVNAKTGKKYTFEADTARIIQKDSKLVFQIENLRSIGIPQAIIQKDFTVKDIGRFEILEKLIDINGDKKRLWLDQLENLNETNSSMPLFLPFD